METRFRHIKTLHVLDDELSIRHATYALIKYKEDFEKLNEKITSYTITISKGLCRDSQRKEIQISFYEDLENECDH
jgi:hypothetical protein